jgi:hypothetical protein
MCKAGIIFSEGLMWRGNEGAVEENKGKKGNEKRRKIGCKRKESGTRQG